MINILCFITIFLLSTCASGCRDKVEYGLSSSDGHYLFSYYVPDSELVVKNMKDFDEQLESKEFNDLKQIVDKSDKYYQAEVLFEPIVQRVIPGNKYVFVFETTKDYGDYMALKRLAFQCDKLDNRLVVPSDCRGYYLETGGDFPPDFHELKSGQIILTKKSEITGTLTGHIEAEFEKRKRIAGNFRIYDRRRELFLTAPANKISK